MADKKKNPSAIKTTSSRVAITGSAGFIGSCLLDTLEKDPSVEQLIALDTKEAAYESKKTKYYHLDLTETLADARLADILKREQCDTLLHCALPVTPPKNPSYAHELVSVGTMYVLNACAEARIRKIILASTTDVYGASIKNPNFLQEDVHEPKGFQQGPFLTDKIDAEKQVLNFSKKHPSCTATILRPCTILGPTVNSYKTRFLRNLFVTTILGFDPLVQFLHEEDLMKAFKLALQKNCPGIFNIVGDGVLPLSRVIKICGRVNFQLPQFGFKTLVQLAWLADLSPAPGSHVDFLRYTYVAEGSKAKKILEFNPGFSYKEALISFVGAEKLREIQLIEA